MFLNTDQVKIVQANKDNIMYYNAIYDSMKTDKAREAAERQRLYILKNQPSTFRKIFCCAKPFTGKEEGLDDEIVEVVYSSGNSSEEEVRIGRIFLKMKERDKDRRIRHLWYQMLAKAKGAMMIREAFNSLTRRIYLFGTSRKLKYQIEDI